MTSGVRNLSVIDVHQFFGIEVEEFPARIAEVDMWMMDHIMNNRLSLEFAHIYARIPLTASPHIRHADALELNWAELLDPKDCTAILGNPESRYRYSIGIVYNTFAWPDASDAQKNIIRELAHGVLTARAAHPDATLADLYDPNAMPPNLRQAHRALDTAVDRLYKRSGFADDRERVEHLFGLYEKLIARLPILIRPPLGHDGAHRERLSHEIALITPLIRWSRELSGLRAITGSSLMPG